MHNIENPQTHIHMDFAQEDSGKKLSIWLKYPHPTSSTEHCTRVHQVFGKTCTRVHQVKSILFG